MGWVEVFCRAAGSFFVLFLLTRMMGKQQISQLSLFNYITGISTGTIAGAITIDPNLKISDGLVSLITWSGLTLMVAIFDMKIRKFRRLSEGEPAIVIKQGKILEQSLKKLHLDMDELLALLRTKNVFSIREVDYAILETNGGLSILLKENNHPLKQKYPIPLQIISDGKIIEENLKKFNLTKEWVHDQITRSGVQLSEIFYAELQKDGNFYLDKYSDQFHH